MSDGDGDLVMHYLDLGYRAQALDDAAERVRRAMDLLWYELTDDERAALDAGDAGDSGERPGVPGYPGVGVRGRGRRLHAQTEPKLRSDQCQPD